MAYKNAIDSVFTKVYIKQNKIIKENRIKINNYLIKYIKINLMHIIIYNKIYFIR